jgi:hypothetical protein
VAQGTLLTSSRHYSIRKTWREGGCWKKIGQESTRNQKEEQYDMKLHSWSLKQTSVPSLALLKSPPKKSQRFGKGGGLWRRIGHRANGKTKAISYNVLRNQKG